MYTFKRLVSNNITYIHTHIYIHTYAHIHLISLTGDIYTHTHTYIHTCINEVIIIHTSKYHNKLSLTGLRVAWWRVEGIRAASSRALHISNIQKVQGFSDPEFKPTNATHCAYTHQNLPKQLDDKHLSYPKCGHRITFLNLTDSKVRTCDGPLPSAAAAP